MYFRAQKKLQSEVSLSDTIEADPEGGDLYLADVVGEEDTMFEDLQSKESGLAVRRLVATVLDEREADVIRRRYGLGGGRPQTQKEIAAVYGISRSYVSRRAYCKRYPEILVPQGFSGICTEWDSAALNVSERRK